MKTILPIPDETVMAKIGFESQAHDCEQGFFFVVPARVVKQYFVKIKITENRIFSHAKGSNFVIK